MRPVELANVSPEQRRRIVLARFKQATWAPQRVLYLFLGLVFLAVGGAGFVVPGLPGTVFLLIAVWFFGQSNKRLYRAMLFNRFFGRQLVDYKAGLGIPRAIKIVIVGCIIIFSTLSVLSIDHTLAAVAVVLGACFGAVYILTRPTRERLTP